MKKGIQFLLIAIGVVLSGLAHSATTNRDVVRWPYATIVYEIKPGLVGKPGENTWLQAVVHWEQNTNLTFIKTDSNDPNRSNYPRVLIFDTTGASVCSSGYFDRSQGAFDPPFFLQQTDVGYVDDLTRKQLDCDIVSTDGTGVAIHELGHSVGLIHEQKRLDQAENIFFHRENLRALAKVGEWSVSERAVSLTPYDYASRLHYDPWQTSKGDDYDPLDWVLSLEPPENATAEELALSAYLKAKTPDFEEIFRNKTGLSARDIEGANKLYSPGTADIRADFITKSEWCSPTKYNAGNCTVLRQLSVKSVVANLGPWDSGKVTITHTLSPNYNLNDFDMSSLVTNAGNCQLKQVSYCSSNSCASIPQATRLQQCKAGTLQGCAPHPAIVCDVSSLEPMETISTDFTLIHPDTKGSEYAVIVSSVGSTDDRPHNDGASATLGSNPSCGCSCSGATVQGDSTVTTLALIAAAGLLRSRRRKPALWKDKQ